MKDFIKKIISGELGEDYLQLIISRLATVGPSENTMLEMLGYYKLYAPAILEKYASDISFFLGLFFKKSSENYNSSQLLQRYVFLSYKEAIRSIYNGDYTPVQADILTNVEAIQYFSFSSPTSTGKSYVFLHLIEEAENDVVIVVPSRALLNEYYIRLNDAISEKGINILSHIDDINKGSVRRSVFVVTPERCREIFKNKDNYNISFFLFDEAQLTDDEGRRGLYYDGIVRRVKNGFPYSKCIFAHPFVINPIAQIEKNKFNMEKSGAKTYQEQSVAQLFYCHERYTSFYHFGLDKKMMGWQKVDCSDPIEIAIKNGGSVLFYVSKKKITGKSYLKDFDRYISMCNVHENPVVEDYVRKLEDYTGARSKIAGSNFFSSFVSLLRRGIVIHHGSLPLSVRIIIEKYTKDGFCRLCFATSTLEQGVNMPFDVVVLDRFEEGNPLSIRNMIGRAGRTTSESSLDVGCVVVKSDRMSDLRAVLGTPVKLEDTSRLDVIEEDDEDSDYKEAINNGTMSDEYNLTPNELKRLTAARIRQVVREILDASFCGGLYLSETAFNEEKDKRHLIYDLYKKIYEAHLGRDLSAGEQAVVSNAIKIMMWRIYGKTFSQICQRRYAYVSELKERRARKKEGKDDGDIMAHFVMEYRDLPNKALKCYPMYPTDMPARNVDYDRIICDTYDYLDKLVGFRLTDVYCAAFKEYYIYTGDDRAEKMWNYIKYGTNDQKEIWLLRYGLTFEDIEIIKPHVENIDRSGIKFFDSIYTLSADELACVHRYLP